MQWIAIISAIVFLLSLATISYLSSPTSSYPDGQQSSTETKAKDQTKKEHTLGGFIRFMLPDAISIFTFWLVLATAGLGITAVYQISFLRRGERIAANTAQAAKDSADVAKTTLVASQRAWIKVKVSLGDQPLTFHKGGANTAASFEIVNLGTAPALKITMHAWMIVLKNGGPFPWQEQIRLCDEVRSKPVGAGFTLFPNETFPSNLGYGSWSLAVLANREDIDAVSPTGEEPVGFVIVGCVDYTFPTDDKTHHQTRFQLQLIRNTADYVFRPKIETIPRNEIELREFGMGMGWEAD